MRTAHYPVGVSLLHPGLVRVGKRVLHPQLIVLTIQPVASLPCGVDLMLLVPAETPSRDTHSFSQQFTGAASLLWRLKVIPFIGLFFCTRDPQLSPIRRAFLVRCPCDTEGGVRVLRSVRTCHISIPN